MKAFREPLHELEEFEKLRRDLKKGPGVRQLFGCIGSQKEHLIDALGADYRVRVIVASNELRAREICENYKVYDSSVVNLPARDLIFFQADVHSNLLEQQRIRVWQMLLEEQPVTIVLTMTAFMNHLMPFSQWKQEVLQVAVGAQLDPEEMKKKLVRMGYTRATQVEAPGDFASRGSIIDIYPLNEDNPIRIDLWDDEVDSLRRFDAESQRSIEELQELRLYPASELLLSGKQMTDGLEKIRAEAASSEEMFRSQMLTEEAYHVRQLASECADRLEQLGDPSGTDGFLDYFFPNPESLLDRLPEDTLIVLDEPGQLMDSAKAAEDECTESMQMRLQKGYALPGQTGIFFGAEQIRQALNARRCVALCALERAQGFEVTGSYTVRVRPAASYLKRFSQLLEDLKKFSRDHWRVILISASRTRGMRLAREFSDEGIPAFYSDDPERVLQAGEVMVTAGYTQHGYEYPQIRLAVLSETDIFGRTRKTRTRRFHGEGTNIGALSQLKSGDYVIHETYGLGVYRGIEKISTDGGDKDYMQIGYADGGVLYVPATQLDHIQKYADAGAKKPKLNRLGGTEWKRTKHKVQTSVRSIAHDLVTLYAARAKNRGFECGPDTVWQQEFEEMFPYEETEDQLKAIEETKKDMESPKIMDRLICGDVGFGKTEVALRAAFKMVQEGRQVAFLVPTTILAQQHYNTFTERLKDYPVTVELLCRFVTPGQIRRTLDDVSSGKADIVIGTHRLLSKDVHFKQLGLLVIDEEQRFGVTHKEKIKQLKQDVDVLTLTATPIPRTLHMSLIGIRDMSLLQEGPSDRQPIQTFVMEYNEEMIREAVSREVARGGQAYIVYNRVRTIADMTARIEKLLPQARIAYAHGQMREMDLERIMVDFVNGDIDVLVSTTIIETGLDIPNVNTMIICDADKMGLSQLYQLRGRIGRSGRTAYAFLMYRKDKMLRETAEKRLTAIREFTDLGSGVRIAMRDLEIRGAGNLLGQEQSGHIEEIGYDLYCKLLNEAVRDELGESKPTDEYETVIELDADAYIPPTYIASEEQRLDVYKRIALIGSEEDKDDMLEELIDRFGEPPRSVQNLLFVARLRSKAHEVYVTELRQKGDELRLMLYEKAAIDVSKIDPFVREYRGRLVFKADKVPMFFFRLRGQGAQPGGSFSEGPLALADRLIAEMHRLLLDESNPFAADHKG